MSDYGSISLLMFEHNWILLNDPEYAWKNCSDYARVLNMLQYSYNNIIIIVTNVILELLPARFAHSGVLLPFYLFQHKLEHKNNES